MEDGPTNTDLDYNLNKLEITNAQHHDEPSQTFSNVIITNDLLYDIVLSYCTPATFLRLSRTSQSSHAAVKSYMGRAFRLDRIYSRFFTSPVAFRQMQARTGALVSGSAALQFFDRSYYPEADMDIYVFAGFRFEVAEFLFQDGYEFVPEEHQKSKFQLAALDSELNIGEYEFKGVITVFTFEKKKVDGKVVKAQIVLAANGPFEAILGFHSTCVMNVISCDTAYSLYPKATFEERTSLVCITSNTTKTIIAKQKYRNRGWTVTTKFTELEYEEDYHVHKVRWVGDQYCWSIPLDTIPIPERIPLREGSKPLTCDPVVACTWELHKGVYTARMRHSTFHEPLLLKYRYSMVDTKPPHKLIDHIRKEFSVSQVIHWDADYIAIFLEHFRTRAQS